jgi:hypothetical protein
VLPEEIIEKIERAFGRPSDILACPLLYPLSFPASQLLRFFFHPTHPTHLLSMIRTGLKRLMDRQDETNNHENPLIR